jgi:DDE family transposase
LQKLADETGLVIGVHHYPPGTSKWNKIEHRLFCHITQNWRGRRSRIVLRGRADRCDDDQDRSEVESAFDIRSYQKGIKIRKAEMKGLDITGDQFHPEWNYTIRPRQPSKP